MQFHTPRENGGEMVDFRFINVPGNWQHFSALRNELNLLNFKKFKLINLSFLNVAALPFLPVLNSG
tara:strand:- start:12156 stop:12353 length:198 start_codon:yes stop_codon:yes gene_type:complete